MNIAYLDPPYSRYFERLAGRLALRTGGRVVALLSSPAYRPYTGDNRAWVWPPGALDSPPRLPPGSGHATWSQPVDERFLGVFWHAVAWFRQRFVEEGTTLCLAFSDARPFSLAAALAAQQAGVEIVYFERGAYRFRTASLSMQGLNSRFSLQRARTHPQITGVTEDVDLKRRPQEPWLRWNFVRFIAANALACVAAPDRRRLQHKRYAFGPYIRLALVQWWAERRLARRNDAGLQLQRGEPIIVVPLQLPGDSQLLLHSPFRDNQHFLDFVVEQALAVAPAARVLVKRHPMDSTRYRLPAPAVSVGGNLERFFRFDPVFVCVNSTVGFEAAAAGRPVICFGDSFYTDIEPVVRVTPAAFGERLAAALRQPSRRPAGRRLRADVLRWYQAPGDAWAFTGPDLDLTADIVLQHYRAALAAPASAASAAPAGAEQPEPVPQPAKP